MYFLCRLSGYSGLYKERESRHCRMMIDIKKNFNHQTASMCHFLPHFAARKQFELARVLLGKNMTGLYNFQ